jgi:regulator of protease activity HflC (stomatin/prohibitin superfamily)
MRFNAGEVPSQSLIRLILFPLESRQGGEMTIFDPAHSKVVDSGSGRRGGFLRLIGIGIAGFILVILFFSSITRVDTGRVGVITLFGKVTGETLGEGIHLINPMKTDNEMSVQTQTIKESASVPSSEGLMISLDTSLIYHLNPQRAAEVFEKIGADYEDKVVEPTLRSAIREATASHTANALYTSEREAVANQVQSKVTEELSKRGMVVENVLLRDINLPATLKASIEAKQQAEQEALAMNFRLQKETQEAQRKRIEAAGVRDFQQIVAQGITPSLLEWKGIEATETLAKSPNTKIVVIGNNKNGLPLVMGQ